MVSFEEIGLWAETSEKVKVDEVIRNVTTP